MDKPTCSIDGCERSTLARGWCRLHYERWRKYGSTEHPSPAHIGCDFDGCPNAHAARGYCSTHAKQLRRGEALRPLLPTNISTLERFESKVNKTDGCWLWTASRNPWGYAFMNIKGRSTAMHRWSYEHHVGPIPEGMHIDHICQVRHCVNPSHLRPATPKQNAEYRKGANANSASGVRGVHKSGKKWVASVRHNDRLVTFGRYSTIAEAEQAVTRGRAEIFTFAETQGG